jgi:hypothetical protein
MFDRIIKTTITIGDAERVFLSAGGINATTLRGDIYYMRQDFFVKSSVNVGVGGLHTAEIKLFNLSEATAREIQQQGNLIRLEAGYEGKTGVIFEGRISSVTKTKLAVLEPDIITTLFCVSGLEKLEKATINEAIVREDIKDFLLRIARKSNLAAIIDEDVNGVLVNRTFDADISFVLTQLSSEFGFQYYWNEKSLYIKKTTNEPKIVKTYDPTSGILDIPIITEMGVDLRVFLDPSIKNGDGFALSSQFANFDLGGLNFLDRIRGFQVNNANRQVNSDRYQGNYQVLELEHNGSSHENTWETFIRSRGIRSQQVLNKSGRVDIS